jgi:hypothetical protein
VALALGGGYAGGKTLLLWKSNGSKAKSGGREVSQENARKLGTWKGGRVVDCTGLENRQCRKAFEGSNPSPSAQKIGISKKNAGVVTAATTLHERK